MHCALDGLVDSGLRPAIVMHQIARASSPARDWGGQPVPRAGGRRFALALMRFGVGLGCQPWPEMLRRPMHLGEGGGNFHPSVRPGRGYRAPTGPGRPRPTPNAGGPNVRMA